MQRGRVRYVLLCIYMENTNSSLHFVWTEEMSVGEATIDEQHQKLLSQLNKVVDAMVFGAESTEVTVALSFFKQYVNEHLAYEEDYMQRRAYTGIEEHKKMHQVFRDAYANFKESLDSGKTPEKVLVELEEFLGKWWIEHIGHEDKKYFVALGPAA